MEVDFKLVKKVKYVTFGTFIHLINNLSVDLERPLQIRTPSASSQSR